MLKVLLAGVGLFAGLILIAPEPHAANDGSEPVRVVKLSVAKGKVVGPDVETTSGIGWILVDQGETIELRWSTDEHVSLHLHGYNLAIRLPKGTRSTMRVQAKVPGRFPVNIRTLVEEVEEDAKVGKADQPSNNRMLFYLDVLPRRTAAQ